MAEEGDSEGVTDSPKRGKYQSTKTTKYIYFYFEIIVYRVSKCDF